MLLVTMTGLSYGIYWNARAAAAVPLVAKSKKIVVALGTLMMLANLVLLFTDVAPQEWLRFTRGIGILVYYFVWAGPAKATMKGATQVGAAFEKEVYDRLDLMDQRLADRLESGDEG